jgi:hypothetical protein
MIQQIQQILSVARQENLTTAETELLMILDQDCNEVLTTDTLARKMKMCADEIFITTTFLIQAGYIKELGTRSQGLAYTAHPGRLQDV